MHLLKNKKELQGALERNDIALVAGSVQAERKLISLLVRISYDKETLAGWRAIRAMGAAARELVKTDAAFLRETCRRLLWTLNDESGGIGWSSPELLGEIVSADPDRFSDIVPLIAQAYDFEEQTFRAGVVYALGRIAGTHPMLAAVHPGVPEAALSDPDPRVRILALELVERTWKTAIERSLWTDELQAKLRKRISVLAKDMGESWIYKESDFENILVGETAKRVIISCNFN